MRKIISMLALAAVVISPIWGGIKSPISNQEKVVLTKLDTDYSDAKNNPFVVTLDEDAFDYSANGFGWYNGHNRKIGYDVQSGIYGTIYRQKDASGTGALGGMVGTWGTNETSNLYKQTTDAGTRYPHVTAKYGFIWGIWGDYISDNGAVADPYITIYNIGDEEWSSNIKIVDEGGASAPGTWSPTGDITKKPDGTYILATAWEVDGINSGNRSIIIGKTTNPTDPASWTFSDYQDIYIKKGEGLQSSNNPKFVWGVNGFGIAITTADIDGEGKFNLSYIFTKDYGENWEMGEQNGFSSFKQINFSTLFPNIWQQSVDNGASTISNIGIRPDFDVIVDENNMVHFVCKISGDNGTENYAYTDANEPINGWWDIHGTLNTTGDDLMWNPVFIAQPYGWINQKDLEEFNGEGAVASCAGRISIGNAGNGNLYVGWLDRPENLDDIVASPYAANFSATPPNNSSYKIILDGYSSYSRDHGNTWYHGTEASGTVLAKGVNVTNTQPTAGDTFGINAMEEGWCVSDYGSTDDAGNITFYAINQYADKNNSSLSPKNYASHEQSLRIWKININANGIEANNSLTESFVLSQNYPNPFNPRTSINFELKNSANVNLTVFNAKGEVVANLMNKFLNKGSHSINFDGSKLNSGVYYYKLQTAKKSDIKKMLLVK